MKVQRMLPTPRERDILPPKLARKSSTRRACRRWDSRWWWTFYETTNDFCPQMWDICWRRAAQARTSVDKELSNLEIEAGDVITENQLGTVTISEGPASISAGVSLFFHILSTNSWLKWSEDTWSTRIYFSMNQLFVSFRIWTNFGWTTFFRDRRAVTLSRVRFRTLDTNYVLRTLVSQCWLNDSLLSGYTRFYHF